MDPWEQKWNHKLKIPFAFMTFRTPRSDQTVKTKTSSDKNNTASIMKLKTLSNTVTAIKAPD